MEAELYVRDQIGPDISLKIETAKEAAQFFSGKKEWPDTYTLTPTSTSAKTIVIRGKDIFYVIAVAKQECSDLELSWLNWNVQKEPMNQVALLRAACCVAGVDGQVSQEEQNVLSRLANEVGVGAASLADMIKLAETDKRFYEEQFRVVEADPQVAMQVLFRVALADGILHKGEAMVLKRLANKLRVPPAHFDAWLEQALAFLKRKRNEK